MIRFNTRRFNEADFNSDSIIIIGSDSFSVSDGIYITSTLATASDTFGFSEDIPNIGFDRADSISEEEIPDTPGTAIVGSDSFFMDDSDILLIVQVINLVSFLETTSITATISASDSFSESDSQQLIVNVSDNGSIVESTNLVISPISGENFHESESTQIIFNVVPKTATLFVHNALGGLGGIAIRTTPQVSESGGTLYVPQSDIYTLTDPIVINIPSDINIIYDVELSTGDFFRLAIFGLPSSSNLGTAIRAAAGQSTGTQTLKTITGNITTLFGLPPSVGILIRVLNSCIDKAGAFRTRELVTIPVGSNGAISIQLPSTSDLYAPDGSSTLYEIVRDFPGNPRIGKLPFSVPSGSGPFTFSTSGGSIIVS